MSALPLKADVCIELARVAKGRRSIKCGRFRTNEITWRRDMSFINDSDEP